MTWKGSGYSVRSPLAARAVALAAPYEVTGTGTDSSTSFDVQFGYAGEYAATAHGLVGSVPLTGSLLQDVDQTFPSDDDGAGGVVTFPITLNAAAFVRWSLAMPGIPDDIDLYLLDPTGEIIAASTGGGSESEVIDLVGPPDGIYTLAVHGWEIPSAPLAFSIDQWVVPAVAGGGSLTVDSAPAAAVIGEVGEVVVSWTGLTAGARYLGAVAHNDATGVIGLTVVSVDA